MRVYPEKLSAEMTRGIAPVYVISGDEPLLVQESADVVRAHLRAKGFTEREVHHADARFDWDQVLFSAGSMSLFGDRKLIDLRLPTGKPGDKGSAALVTLAGQLSTDTVLLLTSSRIDARAKWYKSLDAAGVVVEVKVLAQDKFPGWLRGRLKAAGLTASAEAVEVLAERLEGNLLAAVQEIERLRLTVPGDTVDVDTVIEDVSDNARFDVFLLLDAALGGDVARALRVVEGLRSEGVDILYITIMAAREIRPLAQILTELRPGVRADNLLKKYRIWPKRQPLIRTAIGNHTSVSANRLLRRLHEIDKRVKGLAVGDPWVELRSLMVELAGGHRGLPQLP